jgi:hypothetical protein
MVTGHLLSRCAAAHKRKRNPYTPPLLCIALHFLEHGELCVDSGCLRSGEVCSTATLVGYTVLRPLIPEYKHVVAASSQFCKIKQALLAVSVRTAATASARRWQ